MNRLSVLYITVPSFFDLELSLFRELNKIVDLKIIMLLIPQSLRSSAFEIKELPEQTGFYNWESIKGLEKYKNSLPLDNISFLYISKNNVLEMRKVKKHVNKYLRNNHFDLLHATSLSKFATFIYPNFFSIKHRILTIHDPVPHDKKSLLKRIIHKHTIAKFHNILLLNKIQHSELLKDFHIRKPIIYFSKLGVYDFFKTTKIKEIPDINSSKYFLFFGRIEPYKGVDIIINSFLKSNAIKNGFDLIIAGKGNIQNKIEHPNIKYINRYISNEELSGLIKKAFYVLATYQSATQSGVIMTSFALGTPVMVTPVGNLAESIKTLNGEEMGLVCKDKSEKCIKETIDKAIEEPALNINFRQNIEYATSENGELCWKKIAQELLLTYQKILK